MSAEPVEEAEGEIQENGAEEEEEGIAEPKNLHPENDSSERNDNAAVLQARGDADGMVDRDQNGTMTSSDQMVQANLCTVVRKVYPMLFSTFFGYFVTLTLWPGVYFSTYDGNSNWFATIIVLLFNAGDFTSRLILMVRALRPTPLACLIGSVSRVLFIPLIVLCVHGTIHSEVLPYILVTLFGLTNGYFGTMSMIYCPPDADTVDGRRAFHGWRCWRPVHSSGSCPWVELRRDHQQRHHPELLRC
eukprot:gene5098-biopygen10090